MTAKQKYPRSFYDDGLGDILEFIDDEILIHSESRKERETGETVVSVKADTTRRKKRKSRTDDGRQESYTETTHKQSELYGDNDLDEIQNRKTSGKKVNFVSDNQLLEDDQSCQKLDKKSEYRVRGLINRLAAQTMAYVVAEFEELYSTNSRASINRALLNTIDSSIIQESSVAKRKIVAELMLLVSYLSHKISQNIGASLVHHLAASFERLYSDISSDEDKRLDNIIFCLGNIYIIGLISANVVFEFTRRLCSSKDFRPKSTELLLIVLKNIGFQLRKDNPSLMRQLIMMCDEQCKLLKQTGKICTRIEFIIDALNAIKNNNISKVLNYGSDIDKDTIESTLKSLLKRNRLPEALSSATYLDIVTSANFHLLDLRIDEGPGEGSQPDKEGKYRLDCASKQLVNRNQEKLCKALCLKKPAEKTIFGALLKVTDFVEASNILIGFGTNHCSDIMIVCLQVAVHEKTYNPFYFNVINNLCKFNRKYKMAAKFAIQDKIKGLNGMSSGRVDILKQLCFELIKSDAIPITVLKSIEWANIDNSTKDFLTYLLVKISDLPDEERSKIMLKSDRRSTFAGAMRTFTSCFLNDVDLFQ